MCSGLIIQSSFTQIQNKETTLIMKAELTYQYFGLGLSNNSMNTNKNKRDTD